MEYGPFAGDGSSDYEARAYAARMRATAEYGILTNYVTGEPIRPASWGEWARSMESGPTGVFWEPSHGDVFVSSGPERQAS